MSIVYTIFAIIIWILFFSILLSLLILFRDELEFDNFGDFIIILGLIFFIPSIISSLWLIIIPILIILFICYMIYIKFFCTEESLFEILIEEIKEKLERKR